MFPFTAAQYQELQHQALICKYMTSGIPVPPDLLFSVKRSCYDSPFSSKLFPYQPSHMGWSCFQMGLGRKIDPEPGRCRRTDGKKWRCSKEAYPDSKYCERHMHRGKNRSRKPVELGTLQPATTAGLTTNVSSPPITVAGNPLSPPLPPPPTSSHSLSLLTPEVQNHSAIPYSGYLNSHVSNYQFLSSPYSSSPRTRGFCSLDSGGSSLTSVDYRNPGGMKEEVNEHSFFSEPSGSVGDMSNQCVNDTWQLTPLTMSSSCSSNSSSKQRSLSLSSLHNEYSYLQLQSMSEQDKFHQNYLMEGNGAEKEEEPQKTVHRFFDEWPPKNKDSWLELDDKSSSASVSTTRLSISIPSHEFPLFNSRTQYDG